MGKYYLLSWKEGKDPLASAFAPKGSKADHELIKELSGIDELPFELNLVKLDVEKNGLVESNELIGVKEIWRDYQPNSLAWPLMSEKLKDVIDSNLTGKEGVEWINAIVNGNGEQKKYYIPRFKNMLDVLDQDKTMFVQGTNHIIRPVFSLSKIKELHLFSKPSSHDLWKITSGIYISEVLKKAIQKAKITGVDFDETLVT